MNKIKLYYWTIRNKISNKLTGVVKMKARGKKKGDVLISYFTEPFTVLPPLRFSNYHTMYWECYEIARLFSERGYSSHIINNGDKRFIPNKPYKAFIDTGNDLERFKEHLPGYCKTVFHILISHYETYNRSEEQRLDMLKKRRGIRLTPKRKMPPSKSAELADFLEGYGNKKVYSSFARFNKPIFFIPISTVVKFDFPEDKDWTLSSKHYLWIGGGGAVLKGLDLALEAFLKMPDLHLHVCGPVHAEKDFVEAYKKELTETPNIHVYGRIDVNGQQFRDICKKCSAVVYPSGGDGTSGAIVQAMHAGLIPIISHDTGIQEDSGYIPIGPDIGEIIDAVRKFEKTGPDEKKRFSRKIWEYARKKYTREEFSRFYAMFIDKILKLDEK